MSVLQLIEDRTGDKPRIEPLPNPDELPPEDFENDGVHTVDLGSDALIQFAGKLSRAGFRILEFSLVDRFFAEVDADTKKELEPLLRKAATADSAFLESFKHQFLVDLFVDHVRMYNRNTGNVVTLGQEGVIHAQTEDIESLSNALNGV